MNEIGGKLDETVSDEVKVKVPAHQSRLLLTASAASFAMVARGPPITPTQVLPAEPKLTLNVPVPLDSESSSTHCDAVQPVPVIGPIKLPGPCVVDVSAGVQMALVVVDWTTHEIEVPEPVLSSVPGEPTPLSKAPPFVSEPEPDTAFHCVLAPKAEAKREDEMESESAAMAKSRLSCIEPPPSNRQRRS